MSESRGRRAIISRSSNLILAFAVSSLCINARVSGQPVDFEIRTHFSNDTVFVGGAASLIFSMDANGDTITSVVLPMTFTYSSANFIGQIREDTELVWSEAVVSTFMHYSMSSYLSGYNPDSLRIGCIDWGPGPVWTDSGEICRINFVPSDTGTMTIDTAFLPPAVGYFYFQLSGDRDIYLDWKQVITAVPCPVLMGDMDQDSVVNTSDIIYLINYLFKGGPWPQPMLEAADANCSGGITAADAIWLVNYLFRSGENPCGCFWRRL